MPLSISLLPNSNPVLPSVRSAPASSAWVRRPAAQASIRQAAVPRHGHHVNSSKIEALNSGNSYIVPIAATEIVTESRLPAFALPVPTLRSPDAIFLRVPTPRTSVVRHTDGLLLRLALARLTFSRMSVAFAVQMKGLGWRLCSSI